MDGPRKKQGFASMTPEKRRQVASLGGKRAQANGRAHRFTREEARAAGRIGGLAASRIAGQMVRIGRIGGDVVSRNRPHMAAIGSKGGSAVSKDKRHMSRIGRAGGLARKQA